jgi:hypothetical protein
MEYPDICLKGIPNDTYLLKESKGVATHLFYFTEKPREDNWVPQSVNWEDDPLAIKHTLEQRRTTDGELQFQAGVAKVPRESLDNLKNQPMVKDILSYERRSLPENKYHGNLLLFKNTDPLKMKQIAASIALLVSEIIPQGN